VTQPTSQFVLKVCRLTILALIVPVLFFVSLPTNALQIEDRTVQMNDSRASATNVTYKTSFTTISNSSIGSVAVEFCDNNPFASLACVAPTGFDASASAIVSQTGITNFTKNPLSTSNRIILSRPIANNYGPGSIEFELNAITNPDSVRTFFARITTYASTDGTGAYNNDGGVAMMTTDSFSVSAEVPPYLLFCSAVSFSGYNCNSATDYLTDFGELSSTATKGTTSQLILVTNADFGLSVTISGNDLSSGTHVIPSMGSLAGPTTGVSQFGVNLRANTSPAIGSDVVGPGSSAVVAAAYNNPNQYKFTPGDTVITANDVVDYRKFTASYIVNINANQAPGVYSTTITYICLAYF